MILWQKYHLAVDTDDALHALANAAGPARLVAGGTDLLLDLQQGRCPPVHTLVDVTRCKELNCLEMRGEGLFIGAAVPLSQLCASSLVWEHAQALWEACGLIAGPQVRNTATLGGNVAHALPAGDGSIALLALRAQVEVASLEGSRLTSLESLFLGPGKSALRLGEELLVGFTIPLKAPGQASAFKRVMRPQGVALPVLNMAAWLQRDGEQLADLALAIGPAGRIPCRGREVESVLIGKTLNEAALQEASLALLASVHFRTSPHRASSGYRQHISTWLLRQTLEAAWAGGEIKND
jgi:carbon-monoxide dehydrogenase medium subunit